MKKQLFFLILLSFYCLNAKIVGSSSYLKPKPGTAILDNQYPNYYQTIEARYLVGSSDWTSDGANGIIEITNNHLYVNFDPSWTYNQSLTTGIIAYINISPALPNIELGPIYGDGQETGYYAKIEDNNLVVYTSNSNSGPYFKSLYFGISIDLNCVKTWYKDADSDGFGDPASLPITDCYQPSNYVDNNLDCDDQNIAITIMQNWYVDADNDGYGSGLDVNPYAGCEKPSFGNYASNNLDCDDSNGAVNPAALWYTDTDNDGFGDWNGVPIISCTKPVGNYVINKLDRCPDEYNLSNNGCTAAVSNENYVRIISPTVANTSLGVLPAEQKIDEITYFDGLGRPMQKIGIAAGGNAEDIITHIGYDDLGRQEKEYLPYAEISNNGVFRTGDLTLQTKNFYDTAKYENTNNPYSQKEFQTSPMNRVLKQAAPGEAWKMGSGHEISYNYQTNIDDDYVRRFGVSYNAGNKENPNLEDEGFFTASELYKTITKDENWLAGQAAPNEHTSVEFKDKQDRIVLKRTYGSYGAASVKHDTYYVYDEYGNLTFVIPPKADDLISGSSVNVLADQTSSAVINPASTPV
ncbi:hypothetical protein D3C84_418310 [compost metagenome]